MRGRRFENKVSVITGAAQGIGRATALQMAAEGARLVLVDRSEIVHEVADQASAAGARAVEAVIADLEHYSECCRALDSAHQTFGVIDILVNNVGGTIWTKPYQHYEESQIEAEVRRSLFPTLWCCHA
ncbi:MAG: SDR family NAD(P)-dependent oxidoreductase, partial [Gammaproteobacteria bacterium]|nr:SDR family NAD(P)-dependent oxidoreductase [Gammaproteobacteria bacterium]